MKFKDLIDPVDNQTDEELRERLRLIRFNRERARPVATKKAAKAEKKEGQKRATKIDKLVQGMSLAELEALMKKLQQ